MFRVKSLYLTAIRGDYNPQWETECIDPGIEKEKIQQHYEDRYGEQNVNPALSMTEISVGNIEREIPEKQKIQEPEISINKSYPKENKNVRPYIPLVVVNKEIGQNQQ
jgi:hypothetical protein